MEAFYAGKLVCLTSAWQNNDTCVDRQWRNTVTIIKLHGHEFEHDIKYCIRLYRQTLYVTEKEILVKYITCLQREIHAVFSFDI